MDFVTQFDTDKQGEAAWVVIETLKRLPAKLAARVQSDMKRIAKPYMGQVLAMMELNDFIIANQKAEREEEEMRKRRPAMVVGTVLDDEDDEDYLPPEDESGAAPVSFFAASGTLPVIIEPLAAGQSIEERTFWLPKEKLPEAEQAAKKLGLRLEILDNSIEDLTSWMIWEIRRNVSGRDGEFWSKEDREAVKKAAANMATKLAQIRIHYPEAEYSIIATAEMLSPDKTPTGLPMAKLTQSQSYWSDERIRSLDFQRCDECGVRSHRKYVYVVAKKHADQYVQLGGSCAAQLDLSQKLKAMIKAVDSFSALARQFLVDAGYMEPAGSNGGMRLRQPLNISVYAKLTDFLCGRLGFVSGKQADMAEQRGDTSVRSTSERVFNLVLASKSRGEDGPTGRLFAQILQAYDNPVGQAYIEDLIRKAQAKADSLDPERAVSDFRHSAQMAIYGGFGAGILVWLIAQVRGGGQETVQEVFGKAQPWGTVTPMRSYEDDFGIGYSDLVPIAARGGWASVPDMIHTMLDVVNDSGEVTSTAAADAEIARIGKLDKRGVPLNRSPLLDKALHRSIQGLWWVANRFEKIDPTYGGMSYSANLVRLDDYAIIYVTGKGLADVKQNQVVRILGASRKGITKGYFSNYLKCRIPDSMKVDRATLEIVDGVVPFSSEAAFIPKLADPALAARVAVLTMAP